MAWEYMGDREQGLFFRDVALENRGDEGQELELHTALPLPM